MPDRIELRGLRVMGRHGVLREEHERAQPFEVDLAVELDLGLAGRSDDLADTLDYAALVDAAAGVVAGAHQALLETLAERIAGAVSEDRRVLAVAVSVRKLRPPVPHDLAAAGVTIERRYDR